MKIIVDMGRKKEIIKLDSRIFLCVLPKRYKFILKSTYKKLLKLINATEDDTYYLSDNLEESVVKKLAKITPFSKINTSDIFLKNIENIIKSIITNEKISISIYSDKKDDRIFELISSVNNFCYVIHLITTDENFFETTSDYSLEKYGIALNLKKFEDSPSCPVNIVLNTEKTDFSSKKGCVINLSDCELESRYILYDISPLKLKNQININIKKCCLLEKNCENFNLIWKNSQKSVDKSEK